MDKIFSNKKAICIFMAPGVILFTVILLIPIVRAVYVSLCDWNALTPPKFIGFKNYIDLFQNDPTMMIAIKNSLFFAIFSLITQQILGLVLAVLLTNIKRGRNLFKNIYYLPCVLSSAALGLMFSFLLNPKMGLNQLLAVFGIQGPLWLMDVKGTIPLPMWVIGTVATWQYVGTTMMLYMSAISGISKSLYEASYMDGATKVQAFRYITMPLVKPMAKTTILLTCIGSLKFFDLIYNMTQGGPNHKTEVLATHLYDQGFRFFKYGYASAISIVLLVMCLVVTLLVNRFMHVEEYEM
ncbi:N-acetyl-D-glucosamine ABC transport system, permease protein 1 [Lachnospiraceae bacterium KM106-2]|nr:N-acetyl-D-glucosamine ABC transport system, permease protein 1 [Lachnospiraceae bacterium KM106-2]